MYNLRITILSLITMVWVVFSGQAQVVTSEPAFPTGDESVKISFDLKQAQDSRAAALLGQSGGIYLWSGAGSSGSQDGAFEFEPEGQTNFNAPFEPGTMTAEGNDVWSITLTPRSYFNVPEGTPIRILGLLLKNADGSAQTENFYLELSDGAFEVRFESPSQDQLFTAINDLISIEVVVSKAADLTLSIDNQSTPLKTEVNATTLSYDLTVTGTGLRTVTVTAEGENQSATDSFEFFVPVSNVEEDLPSSAQLGINYTGPTSALLALQAPGKDHVHLLGDFNSWSLSEEYQMKRTPDGEIFWLEIDGLTEGEEYIFQYLVDGTIRVGDPYADKVSLAGQFGDAEIIDQNRYPGLKPYPEGLADKEATYLQTGQTAYAWQNDDYDKPNAGELVIYELLVRDFTDERTYDAVRERLEYIQSIGVNAIQLMPIKEFDGNISWGYNPSFFFAPDKYYGSKQALKRLIDEAHGMGMVVILDMVLNHAWGPNTLVRLYNEGDYGKPLPENPWLNPEPRHPFNVGYDFNHESLYTQAFVDSVNHYWLNEYRFDGFRFDLSKGFTQNFTGNDVGAWNAYDAGRVELLKRMYDRIKSHSPDAYVILEHLGTSAEEKELADYGMMLWGNFNHQFREMAKGSSENFGWMHHRARDWNDPHVVAYMESHDEERLMWDALNFGATNGQVSLRELEHAVDRIQMLTTFFFSVPGAKMLWQFGEFGYDEELNNDRTGIKPTRWEYLDNPHRQRLLKLYQEVLRLRSENEVFHSVDFTMDLTDDIKRIILKDDDLEVFVVGNFGTGPVSGSLEFPSTGEWYDYFTGNVVDVADVDESFELAMNQFHVLTNKPLDTPAGEISRFTIGDVITSVEENTLQATIEVYPSPSDGEITINLGVNGMNNLDLTISDLSGRQIGFSQPEEISPGIYQTRILDSFDGVYVLSLSNGTRLLRKKIIVKR